MTTQNEHADQRQNRNMMWKVMSNAGFANYEGEMWHWSYGDQLWAVFTGQPKAIYNRVATPGVATRRNIGRTF